MNNQKQYYKLTSFDTPTTFNLSESVKTVVEKCVLAPANRLICIDNDSE